MFPPKIAESLEQGVSNLWESLKRAGDHWSDEAAILDAGPKQPECSRVVLRLTHSIPSDCEKSVAAFIKSYLLRSGWKVRSVRITKRYVELLVSNI